MPKDFSKFAMNRDDSMEKKITEVKSNSRRDINIYKKSSSSPLRNRTKAHESTLREFEPKLRSNFAQNYAKINHAPSLISGEKHS